MEDLVEKLELNDKQQKAFKNLKKAFNECKKSGIHFEQFEEDLIALNSKKVSSVQESNGSDGENEIDLQEFIHNSININVTPWVSVMVSVTVKK
jgi:hypothetical protein